MFALVTIEHSMNCISTILHGIVNILKKAVSKKKRKEEKA